MIEASPQRREGLLERAARGLTQSLEGWRSVDGARAFRLLQAAVVTAFAGVLTVSVLRQTWDGLAVGAAAVFLLIALSSELLPVRLADGNGEITLTPVIVSGVVALFGPGYAVIVAFLAASLGSVIHKRLIERSVLSSGFWQYLLYNSCCIGFHAGVGALMYQALGGPRLVDVDLATFPLSRFVFPLLISTFFALALDMSLFSIGSAVVECADEERVSASAIWMRAKVIWLRSLVGLVPNYLMFTPFAFVLAYLYVWRGLGFWGVLPILVPFFSVRHALNVLVTSVKAYRQTTTTLAMLMQKYHPYTRGHLKRVADLSLRLARELRLPAASQQWIWEAGLLHDIGKVGVSEQILDKPGKLTDEEWDTIKAHPVKSAEILSQLEFLDALVPWVRHHHERVDGRGYPDGLKEDEIPVEAAIIAVADAFDAMTGSRNTGDGNPRRQCDACEWKPAPGAQMPPGCPECGATLTRVYRQPMSVEEGLDQLREGVGTQFSPRVVRAFVRMMAREEVSARG